MLSLILWACIGQNAEQNQNAQEFVPWYSRAQITRTIDKKSLTITHTNEEEVYNLKLVSDLIQTRYELKWTEVQYYEVTCNQKIDWWPEEWWGYESLTDEGKARLLSDLVEPGSLPYEDALWMIHRGYFRNRPDSWNDFARQLRDADGVTYYYVVVVRGEVNMQRLGFMTKNCTRKNIVEDIRVPVALPAEKIGSETRQVQIKISGAKLFSTEKDMLELRFDGTKLWVVASNSNHNVYDIPSNLNDPQFQDVFEVVAKQRLRMTNDWSNARWSFDRSGKDLILHFEDPYFAELMESSPDHKTILNYELYYDGFWSDKKLESNSIEINAVNSDVTFKSGVTIDSGKKYYVIVSFQRRQNDFFETNESREVQSDTLKAR